MIVLHYRHYKRIGGGDARGGMTRKINDRVKGKFKGDQEFQLMALKKSDKWLIGALAALFIIGIAILVGGFLLYRVLKSSFAAPEAKEDGPPLEWERNFRRGEMSRGAGVDVTADGGFIVAAAVWEVEDGEKEKRRKIHLLKTDGEGRRTWESSFDGNGCTYPLTVQEAPGGGFFILGNDEDGEYIMFKISPGDPEPEPPAGGEKVNSIFLLKTDAGGNPEWERTLGGGRPCRAEAGRETEDGGYIIFGLIREGKDEYLYLVKVDAAGEVEWEQKFTPAPEMGGGPVRVMEGPGYSVTPSAEGGYICTARHMVDGRVGLSIFETDESGNILRERSIDLEGDPLDLYVVPCPEGGLMVATNGSFNPLTIFSPSVQLFKLDASGEIEWEQEHRGTGNLSTIALLDDGGWIMLTFTYDFFPVLASNLHLIRTGSSGDLLWKKTINPEERGSIESDYCGDEVVQAPDGALVITGMKDEHLFLLKVAPEKP